MLNRSVLILRPDKPFIDWAASLPGLTVAPTPDEEPTVYLVPAFDDAEGAIDVIAEVWPVLFERELEAWWTDESAWPGGRDVEMFTKWFHMEIHPTVEDVGLGPIIEDGT